LICWLHDDRRISNRIKRVISLQEVFEKTVPPDFQQRIILYPDRIAELKCGIKEEHIDALSKNDKANSIKVQWLILNWPYYQKSGRFHRNENELEIMLKANGKTYLRACLYSEKQYLGVDKEIFQRIQPKYDFYRFAQDVRETRVNLALDKMHIEDVDRLVDFVAKEVPLA
jgi:hypothetical protein